MAGTGRLPSVVLDDVLSIAVRHGLSASSGTHQGIQLTDAFLRDRLILLHRGFNLCQRLEIVPHLEHVLFAPGKIPTLQHRLSGFGQGQAVSLDRDWQLCPAMRSGLLPEATLRDSGLVPASGEQGVCYGRGEGSGFDQLDRFGRWIDE
jgi:hypothetical protein